jgi:hypothetical protein
MSGLSFVGFNYQTTHINFAGDGCGNQRRAAFFQQDYALFGFVNKFIEFG